MESLNIFYWTGKPNFGDALTPLLLQRIFPETVIELGKKERLVSMGSVMHFVKDGDTVWGTGVNGKIQGVGAKNFDILALRGPYTKSYLKMAGIKVPNIIPYGDPGLLAPMFFPEFSGLERSGIKQLIHYNDKPFAGIKIIDVFSDPLLILKEICTAELLITTSLHGLIIAEAYNIPVALQEGSEPRFKYQDYYTSTDRDITTQEKLCPILLKLTQYNLLKALYSKYERQV